MPVVERFVRGRDSFRRFKDWFSRARTFFNRKEDALITSDYESSSVIVGAEVPCRSQGSGCEALVACNADSAQGETVALAETKAEQVSLDHVGKPESLDDAVRRWKNGVTADFIVSGGDFPEGEGGADYDYIIETNGWWRPEGFRMKSDARSS